MIAKIKKFGYQILMLLFAWPSFIYADSNVFAQAGQTTQNTVASAIQNWMWLSPFVILVPPIYGMVREHKIAQRQESGQDAEHMDSTKYALKLFKGALIGSAISFIVVSLIGMVFMGMGIGDTWNTFMFTPVKKLFGIS